MIHLSLNIFLANVPVASILAHFIEMGVSFEMDHTKTQKKGENARVTVCACVCVCVCVCMCVCVCVCECVHLTGAFAKSILALIIKMGVSLEMDQIVVD